MERNKIIIIGLVIVIVVLAAGLALMVFGNGNSSDVEVPEGMQVYDFDGAFSMVVDKDVKFLKSWNSTSVSINKYYFNKEDNYLITLTVSDYAANNAESFKELYNSSKYENIENGDVSIDKILDKSHKVDTGSSEKYFQYVATVLEGSKAVNVYGDDLESVKEMANSIRFYGE